MAVEAPFNALLENGAGDAKTKLLATFTMITCTMSKLPPPSEFQVRVKLVRVSICWAAVRLLIWGVGGVPAKRKFAVAGRTPSFVVKIVNV